MISKRHCMLPKFALMLRDLELSKHAVMIWIGMSTWLNVHACGREGVSSVQHSYKRFKVSEVVLCQSSGSSSIYETRPILVNPVMSFGATVILSCCCTGVHKIDFSLLLTKANLPCLPVYHM